MPGLLIDDPKSLSEFPDTLDCDLVVTDPFFCKQEVLSKAIEHLSSKYPNSTITKIYFKNDPKQCYRNALLREGKKVNLTIKHLTKVYEVDNSCLVLECYKG